MTATIRHAMPHGCWTCWPRHGRLSLFVNGRTFQEYEQDLFFRSAVERQIEIIGEAARGISDTFKTAHPQIPWRPIMAQRHRLAHEYGEIDDSLIWKVATVHVPALIPQIEPLTISP